MDYNAIFDFPGWEPILLSVFQTATIYCLIIIGLEIVGRRVFAQRGPQDLIIIVLVAEACDIGLVHEDAGYWGAVASVLTLFILGYLSERIVFVRRLLDEDPVILYRDGELQQGAMKKHMIDVSDLEETARQKGAKSYKEFEFMMLEGDGKISAIRFNK
jgi:uncharacterized membrane protein YcaP (DUF421 family)